MSEAPIYLLPEFRPGHGMGHFTRAVRLADELGRRARIYLPDDLEPARLAALRALADDRGVGDRLVEELPAASRSSEAAQGVGGALPEALLVVDRREIGRGEVDELRRRGFVVAVDAGGPGRTRCDYLVDILPRLDDSEANVRDLRLLDLPRREGRLPRDGGPRVLVTFGGDDPAGVTSRVVTALRESERLRASEIEALLPLLAASEVELPPDVTVVRGPVDLQPMLTRYEIVVTSFGLTAFEAAWADAGVVLVNASSYHEKLARRAGFRSAARASATRGRLRRGIERRLEDGGGAETVRSLLDGADEMSLAGSIAGLAVPLVHDCPACESTRGAVIARFESRTYLRCHGCGMIYLRGFEPARDYPEDYFFEEYRRQYGRTYLEDSPHIEAMGRSRLARIAALGPPGRRLVDLGCAYGPFLSAASAAGYEVAGVDTSEAAVRYVREALGYEAHHLALETLAACAEPPSGLEEGSVAVVTMWYVIEHVPELSAVLRHVRRLLAPGGVFAFSTPNAAGISGRRNLGEFLERSPGDHVTVWTPRIARRVLARYGFEVKRIRVTGHHPERFPAAGGISPDGVLARVLRAASRILGLGDTFEVYAVMRGGPGDHEPRSGGRREGGSRG
jgi:2-polyprenyl-3-methyl-5-hydroxy-6-metoxy-1,4-benzoquinol methylase